MDRFECLQTFVTVAQTGSLSKASERLKLAKSAVSRRLSELETHLGTQLLHRTTRSLRLTEVGAEFLASAERVLEGLELAESVASRRATELSGTLRVTAPMSFGTLHLAPLLGKFVKQHNGLKVDLNLNDSMVDMVHEGFDLAIRISRAESSDLIGRKLASIQHVLVASPAYLKKHGIPRIPNDLKKHQGLIYSNADPKTYWQFRSPTTKALMSVAGINSSLSVNNGCALREAAIAGSGVAYLPDFIAYRAIQERKLRVILKNYQRPPISMYAVYPSKKDVSAKRRAFIDFLVTEFSGPAAWKIDSRSR